MREVPGPCRQSGAARTIAVALHGIEPATYERCAVIRDWLDDHGVDRVTLLVIPARDLHPVGERSPEMVELAGRAPPGRRLDRPARLPARAACAAARLLRAPRPGEFTGLDEDETRRAVHAGWRVLKLAGIEPDGFVAPAYAYTSALRQTLRRRFRWWAGLLRVHARRRGRRRRSGDGLARARVQLRGRRAARRACSRRRWCAPGRCCRPRRCGSTCTRPTSPRPPHDGAGVGAAALDASARRGHLPRARRRLSRRSQRAQPAGLAVQQRGCERLDRRAGRVAEVLQRRTCPRSCAAARSGCRVPGSSSRP